MGDALGEAGEPIFITLYRAVGLAELTDIRATSRLSAGRGSLSGKWFAEELKHAAQWGELLEGPGNYAIVKVVLPSFIAGILFRIERLDGIGPARYVEADQLIYVQVTEEMRG